MIPQNKKAIDHIFIDILLILFPYLKPTHSNVPQTIPIPEIIKIIPIIEGNIEVQIIETPKIQIHIPMHKNPIVSPIEFPE